MSLPNTTESKMQVYNSRSKGTGARLFGQRFNEVLDLHGYPRKGTGRTVMLAQSFDVSISAARKWVEGIAIPGYDKLLTIARTFNVSIDWLLGNDRFVPEGHVIALDLKKEREALDIEKAAVKREIKKLAQLKSQLRQPGGLDEATIHVPVLDGHNFQADALDDTKMLPLPSEWLELKTSSVGKDVAIVEVSSDAMSPTLNSGDKVLIDLATNKLQQNAVYVFRMGDNTMIRRVFTRIDGSVSLISDNAKYPQETIPIEMVEFNTSKSVGHQSESGKLTVIGKTLWAIQIYPS